MENKPDTETQEQNTQASIGPVTATQPVDESPDVVARQRPEPLEYIQVRYIDGRPVYFQNGHEDESPDVIMRQHKLAQDYAQVTGKQQPPLYLLIGHEDEFQSELDEARRAAILADAPELNNWRNGNLEKAVLIDGDLPNYAGWEKAVVDLSAIEDSGSREPTVSPPATFGQHTGEFFKALPGNATSSTGMVVELAGQVLTPVDDTQRIALAIRIAFGAYLSDAEYQRLREDIKHQSVINKDFAQNMLSEVISGGASPEEVLELFGPNYNSGLKKVSQWLQSTGASVQDYGDKLFPAAPGMEDSMGRTLGAAAGSMLPAFILTAVNPVAGGTYVIAESGGKRVSAARKAGQSEEIQSQAAALGLAVGPLNLLSFGKFAEPFKSRFPFLDNAFLSLLGKSTEEGAKEALSQFSHNAIEHFLYNPEKELSDGVVKSFITSFALAPLFNLAKAGSKRAMPVSKSALSHLTRSIGKALKAKKTSSVIDNISTLASTNKLRESSPREFETILGQHLKGKPLETIYFNVENIFDALQTKDIDPYYFVATLGISRQQLDAARNSGGDIKVLTAVYASRVVSTPEEILLKSHIRFAPDAFSTAQAKDYLKYFDQTLNDGRIDVKTTDAAAKFNTERNYRRTQTLLRRSEQFPPGKNSKENVGRAGDSVVQAVQDATGFDISKAKHSLSTKTIRDSLNNTTLSDTQLPVMKADIQVIPDIISSADRIVSGAENALGQPIIGYIKHMSNGETLYLQQTKTGPKTFTVDALTRYPVGEDLDAVSQTVLSDVRAKNGDNVKLTPVKKGDAQPLPSEDGKAHALPQENGDVQPLPQNKAGGKRASASEGRSLGGMGAGGITAFSSAGLAGVVGQFTNHIRDMANEGEPTAMAAMAQLNDWWGQSATSVADAGAQAVDNNDIAATDGATILGTASTDNTAKTAVVDSGLQTHFSQAFETYLLEGKVPSPELADTFETARKWLTTAYRTVTTFGGRTGPEVAEVFNRMLVSDGQLEMARLDAGESGPVFSSAEAMGLSEAAYADFTAARRQSEDEASAEMLQSVMQPVRREQDKAYAQEKATVRTQVEKQVNTEGHYRATELMSNRRWLGDGEMPDHLADIRFDEAMLVAHYGDGILGLLPRGSQTVYTDKGGLDPDDVASIFGYGSGDELLRFMVMAPSRNDRIDSETARIMRERHGDPLYDGTADLKAMDAIHNDRRGQWLEIELKAVGRLSNTTQNTTLKDAHASAVSMMSTMSVADAMESRRFLAAERRAAEEAERLGLQLSTGSIVDPATSATTQNGDAAVDADISTGTSADNNETAKKLYTAKKRQLLNHALYVESRKIAREVEEMERYVQSVDTPARREQFALASFHDNGRINYNSAMDDLLGRYELNASQSMQANVHFGTWAGRQAGATGGLDVFIEQMKAAGRENELAITDEVISSTMRTPYRKLPLQSLRGVVNSIRNLQHIAMRAGKLVDAEQTRDFEQTVSGVLGAFTRTPTGAEQAIGNDTAPFSADTGGTAGTKGYGRPRPYLDPAMNANLVLRDLDGSKKAGTVQAAIKAPVDAASGRLLARKQKAASDLAALYDVYSPAERQDMGRRVHVPALGTSISKWDMIAIALNTGTAENRRQLTDETIAGAFSEQQVVSVLKYLDARDADFVQSVWDYTASFKPDIAAREKRVTGVTPQWVEATPVMIGGKKLAGGYYPLRDNTDDVPQALVAGKFAKAHTSGLHGGQQQGQTAVPLELDMSVLHSHVNELVHDLELSEVLANTGRLLRDERIQAAFIQTGQGADHVMLQGWLRDAATGDTSGAALLSGTARFAKNNVTAARLATELGSSMTQMSGLSEAMTSIGQQQFADNLQTALRPGVMRRVAALSPFMSSRQGTFENSSGGNTSLDGLSSWVMQRLNYQMVEVPVWLAGYHQGLDTYRRNEAKAISHADRLVKRLQTSRDGKPSDNAMTSVQEREVETLLTALGSLMTAKSRTGENSVPQGGMPVSNDAAEGIALAIDIAAVFHTDAVLKALAHGKSPVGDVVSALSIAETMPFFRDAESPKTGAPRRGKAQRYNDNNGTKRLAGMISASGVLNDIDTAGLMATLNTTGLSFGLPATQISQVVEARMPQTKGGETSLMQLLTTKSA